MKKSDKSISPKSVIFRKYKEGDEKQIITLLKRVFREPVFDDEKYWNWMYKNNPTNLMKIWLAEDHGKIVGHYALMPVLMKIEDKLQIGTLAINIAIHPEYQGQGIFSTLVKQTYTELAEEGIPITYVFPNERSYPIFIKKLDCFEIPSLPTLLRPLDLEKLLTRKIHNRYLVKIISSFGLLFLIFFRERKYNLAEKIDVVKTSFFDNRIDEFWKDASKGYKIITVRDKKYLTWRYLDNPNYDYTLYLAEKEGSILGYIVLRSRILGEDLKNGVIVDLLTLPNRKDVSFTLILKAIEHFKEENMDVASCNIQNKFYYNILRKTGFIPVPITTSRVCAQVHTTEIPKNFFVNPENWFITQGDSNAV